MYSSQLVGPPIEIKSLSPSSGGLGAFEVVGEYDLLGQPPPQHGLGPEVGGVHVKPEPVESAQSVAELYDICTDYSYLDTVGGEPGTEPLPTTYIILNEDGSINKQVTVAEGVKLEELQQELGGEMVGPGYAAAPPLSSPGAPLDLTTPCPPLPPMSSLLPPLSSYPGLASSLPVSMPVSMPAPLPASAVTLSAVSSLQRPLPRAAVLGEAGPSLGYTGQRVPAAGKHQLGHFIPS